MGTNFPAALDTSRNPSGQAGQALFNAEDAIAALQAKVGATGSAVTTSLEYRVTAVEAGGGGGGAAGPVLDPFLTMGA